MSGESSELLAMRRRVENLFKKVVVGEVDKRSVTLTPDECAVVKDLIVLVKTLWE